MIAVVTGANGFIGTHLVRRLAADGWEVRAVTRADYESNRLDAHFAGADVVVHAAGATRAPTRAGLVRSNVELTVRTLDAARRAGVRRLVFLSSQAAAGPALSLDSPVSERDTPVPIEAYGRSKLEAERLVATSGLPVVVLRPGAVYGPGDRDFVAMHRLASRGLAVHAGNRAQWISIVHVTDLVRGIVAAATNARAVGETFFLANPDPVQWDALFRMAAECAGRTLRTDVEVPQALVQLGAWIGNGVARVRGTAGLLTTEKIALTRAHFWVCSSQKARACFDFQTPTALHAGVCETYHWYRSQGWL